MLKDTAITKFYRSPTYNFNFNKETGFFMRWGRTLDDDPDYSPVGPEIADIEIVINRCPNACPWCYKGNTNKEPVYMTVRTYERLLDKLLPNCGQVALGITGVQSNPDFIPILKATRDRGVVPNYTLTGADLTDEIVDATVEYCGAVAVSCYPTNPGLCYHTVERFLYAGMKQVNIHLLYYAENYNFVLDTIESVKELSGLNAVVLLAYKPKGRKMFRPVSQQQFDELCRLALGNDVPLGFDSCSAYTFLDCAAREKKEKLAEFLLFSEPCESGIFSSYFNVFGNFFPCSFVEGEPGWEEGLSVLDCNDFLADIWMHSKTVAWRTRLLENKRNCPYFKLLSD